MIYFFQLADDILRALLADEDNAAVDIAEVLKQDKDKVEPVIAMLRTIHESWFIEVKPTSDEPSQIRVNPAAYADIKAFLDKGGFTAQNEGTSENINGTACSDVQQNNLIALTAQARQAMKLATWAIVISIAAAVLALIALLR